MTEQRATTPRDRARAQTLLDITRIGREHLARDGAATLSLRAVARDLGVVSSAVYRYVASRDDLLTLLVVDAFTELADSVDDAAAQGPDDSRAKMHRMAGAMRGWAVAEPARWSLLYGSPVPGYQAPAEQTTGPGTRVVTALMQEVARAHESGSLTVPGPTRLSRPLRTELRAIADEAGLSLPEPAVAAGILWWTSLVGLISAEVFGHLGAETFSDTKAMFTRQLVALDPLLGL